MRRLALPLLVLAACNQVLGLDPVSGDDTPAPIDAPAPMDALVDPDGDGVDSSADNCPDVANPRQEDEDLDGRGNRCDPCPHMAGEGTVNIDGDGVGDLCDADTTNRQCIVWFDGFDVDTLASYRPLRGTWSVDSGAHALVQSNPDMLQGLLLTKRDYGGAWARTGGTVAARSNLTPADPFVVGLWVRAAHTLGDPEPDGCLVALNQQAAEPTSSVVLRKVNVVGSTLLASTPIGAPLGVDEKIAIEAVDVPGSFNGRGYLGPVDAGIGTAACRAANGAIGLRTHKLGARFDYLMIVEPDLTACPAAPLPCSCPPPAVP